VIQRVRRTRQSAGSTNIAGARRRSTLFFVRPWALLESQLQKILAADRRMQIALPPVLIQGENRTVKTSIARWPAPAGTARGAALVEVTCSPCRDAG